mmetsp:Transcript_28656/g.73567  ORF Transcript_28656/g.73567 Transcript_28656/m.73567 type:complete len:221 (-) Transcript_28656:1201-1863(-)
MATRRDTATYSRPLFATHLISGRNPKTAGHVRFPILDQRPHAHRGGHHRLWHGHRQGRRAHGGALQPPEEPGGVLPGVGASRPRRAALLLRALLWGAGREHHALAADQAEGQEAQPRRRGHAAGGAGLRRGGGDGGGGDLPPGGGPAPLWGDRGAGARARVHLLRRVQGCGGPEGKAAGGPLGDLPARRLVGAAALPSQRGGGVGHGGRGRREAGARPGL